MANAQNIYEKALLEVGEDGKFQKKFDIVYNLIMICTWTIATMNIFLPLTVTPYHCKLPEKPDNVSTQQWMTLHIPEVDRETNENQWSKCTIYKYPGKSNDTTVCDEFTYNTTWFQSTVAMQNNWVCDKEIYVVNALAFARIAEVVGSVTFGWVGDVYGRRITYILSLGFTVVGRFISVFSGDSFVLFTVGCIIASIPAGTVIQSITVISLEISSPKRRSKSAFLRSMAWTLGLCFIPMIYWAFQDWKMFIIVTTVPQIIFLAYSWKMIESPRWLWLEGKTKRCVVELKKISKANKSLLDENTVTSLFLRKESDAVKPPSLGPLALFSSWKLALNTTMQMTSWTCMTLSYTFLVMKAGEKNDANPFLESTWQASAEMPGNLLASHLADRVGRRRAGSCAAAVSAVIWIVIALKTTSHLSWLQPWWVETILYTANRFSVNICCYVLTLLNMELYPTCLRQSGMSLGNVVSSAASAVSPYILYLGHRMDPKLPGFILASTSFLAVVTILTLPETLNRKLPETLEDAQSFGIKKQLNYVSEPSE